MAQLTLTMVPIDELAAHPKNARKHPAKQLKQLEKSIEAFGNNTPIIIDESRKILCGHARFEALKRLRNTEIPTICIGHLSEAQTGQRNNQFHSELA